MLLGPHASAGSAERKFLNQFIIYSRVRPELVEGLRESFFDTVPGEMQRENLPGVFTSPQPDPAFPGTGAIQAFVF